MSTELTPDSTEGQAAGTPLTESDQSVATATEPSEGQQPAEGSAEPNEPAEPPKKDEPEPEWKKERERINREKAYLRRQLNRALRENGELQARSRPTAESFASDAEYQAALVDRISQERAAQRQLEDANTQQEDLVERRNAVFAARMEAAKARMPDFDLDAFYAIREINEPMAEVIASSDHAEEIAYYLSKNPLEARRIANLPTAVDQIAATVRLEARLSAAKPKLVSSAPKPVPTVGGKAAPPPSKDIYQLANQSGDDATAAIEEMRRMAAAKGA